MAIERPKPERRDAYRYFQDITTRWMDNDAYGHVNNVVYYSYIDTVVNMYLIEQGWLDIANSPVIGLAVESRCNFFSALAYPDLVRAGLRVGHLGTSSVRYEIGLFRNDEETTSAQGHFVHVYVERATGKPVRQLPEKLAAALKTIVVR